MRKNERLSSSSAIRLLGNKYVDALICDVYMTSAVGCTLKIGFFILSTIFQIVPVFFVKAIVKAKVLTINSVFEE